MHVFPPYVRLHTIRIAAAGALLVAGISGTALAQSELDAKLAIARAQASIDLISKENPGATNDPAYGRAQQKLLEAQDAASHNDDREAVWFAAESELLAERTLAVARLTAIEQTRRAVASDVNILQLELSK